MTKGTFCGIIDNITPTTVAARSATTQPETARNGQDTMPFQAVPGGWLAAFIYTLDGVPVQNTFHYSNPTASPADAQQFANDLVAAWEADIMPFLSSSLVLNSCIVADLSSQSGTVVSSPPAGTGAGGEGGACLPNETAFCIGLRSQNRSRSGRGRVYFSGIPELVRDGINRVAALFATNLRIGMTNALYVGIGANWELAVLSRRNGGVLRPTGELFIVTDIIVHDLILDSMRRRKPKL